MAIQNASDLLVYIKTGIAVKQVTRIKILTTNPLSTLGSLKINNITNASGVVSDNISTGSTSTNTGAAVVGIIGTKLGESSYGYSVGTATTQGDYTYIDVTNGATGLVPTLEIINGSASLKEGSVIIEIVTPGSSNIFDPVAFSTSASFSTNTDLIDVTTKDSEGCSESVSGLKSFELSTELLQSLNPDHPIDGTDFYQKLNKRSTYNISFSDRIRNILTNNTVASGQDGFVLSSVTEQTGVGDPFGGGTASFITASATSNSRLQCNLSASRLEDKKLTWSFYVKAGSSNTATIQITNVNRDSYTPRIISGTGSLQTLGSEYYKIVGLSSGYTRIALEFKNTIDVDSGQNAVEFRIYPGTYNSQTTSTSIYTSSWQFEQNQSVTDYQDPTTVTRWQGDAFVTSIDFDAGVEDNFTCSATFTGTATSTLYT